MAMKIEVTVGIDIGGTNTAIGFVNRQGECVYESSVSTNSDDPAHVLVDRLHALVQKQVTVHRGEYDIKGIGIGAPNGNYVSGDGGKRSEPSLGWIGESCRAVWTTLQCTYQGY